MNTEVIQDKSITAPKKRLLICLFIVIGLIIAWFGTNYATRNALYHQ